MSPKNLDSIPEYMDRTKKDLPTEEELKNKSLKELLEFRGEFEEKLEYLRKNNSADSEILQENEKYHQMLEQVIKDKMNEE